MMPAENFEATTYRKVDVRIIGATNANLEQLVERGRESRAPQVASTTPANLSIRFAALARSSARVVGSPSRDATDVSSRRSVRHWQPGGIAGVPVDLAGERKQIAFAFGRRAPAE